MNQQVTRRTFLQGVAALALAAAVPVRIVPQLQPLPAGQTAMVLIPTPRALWEDAEYPLWDYCFRPRIIEALERMGLPSPIDTRRLSFDVVDPSSMPITDDEGVILFDGDNLILGRAIYDASGLVLDSPPASLLRSRQ